MAPLNTITIVSATSEAFTSGNASVAGEKIVGIMAALTQKSGKREEVGGVIED